jgi:hypothetical protein
MEMDLRLDPAQSGSSERRLARSAECEAMEGMPLSTLLYHVLTESLFMGPVPGMRRRPAAD